MSKAPREAQNALAAAWQRILREENPELVGLTVTVVDERPGPRATPADRRKRDILTAPHDTQPGRRRAA